MERFSYIESRMLHIIVIFDFFCVESEKPGFIEVKT